VAVDILGDQGEDDAIGLDVHSIIALADADEAIRADLIDSTGALIENHRQAEMVFVKLCAFVQVADGQKSDLLVKHLPVFLL